MRHRRDSSSYNAIGKGRISNILTKWNQQLQVRNQPTMGINRTSPKSLEDANSNFSGSIHNHQKQQQSKMRITVTSPQYKRKQNTLASINEVS